MKISYQRPSLLNFVAILLTGHALLFYGLPLAGLAALWILLALILIFAGGAQAMLTACSLTAFTLLLNFAIDFTGLEKSIYYRPHELMASHNQNFGGIYKPNTRFSMNALFGDIEAMEKPGVKEPHEIAYITDSLGFRNPADFNGQKYVMVGDSFVAGANDTQSCLLTEWLRQDHRVDSYNLGFPGNVDEYINRVRAFRKAKGNDFQMALFIYEGNDFQPFTNKRVKTFSLLEKYYRLIKHSSLWRYTRWLYLRGAKNKYKSQAIAPEAPLIGGKPVALFSEDNNLLNNVSPLQEASLNFVSAFQILKPNLVQIFFIPVKGRVYEPWLANRPLPSEQLNYLRRAAGQLNIPVHDLTPSLQAEAARLLPSGQFVYWRDDTHWNCNGMRVAAAEASRVMNLRQ